MAADFPLILRRLLARDRPMPVMHETLIDGLGVIEIAYLDKMNCIRGTCSVNANRESLRVEDILEQGKLIHEIEESPKPWIYFGQQTSALGISVDAVRVHKADNSFNGT